MIASRPEVKLETRTRAGASPRSLPRLLHRHPRHSRLLRRLPILLFALTAACEPKAPERRALPERAVFVAMTRDLQDFRSWGALDLGMKDAQGETHPEGRLRVFVNALPPEGSASYPVGTMIVKESLTAPPDPRTGDRKMFAMVKRGGGFNDSGAKGWEWLELVENDEGVAINWRGLGAPDGEGYGGDPLGTCNSCHEMAVRNDYVLSAALALR